MKLTAAQVAQHERMCIAGEDNFLDGKARGCWCLCPKCWLHTSPGTGSCTCPSCPDHAYQPRPASGSFANLDPDRRFADREERERNRADRRALEESEVTT